jgi:23S rRNA (guanosine2251-2'-O)-methyltransferase
VKTEVLYGIHSVQEALAAARREIFAVYVEKGNPSPRLRAIWSAAESRGYAVTESSAAHLRSMAGTGAHQGTAARVSTYTCQDFSELLDVTGRSPSRPLLALDNIVDPHNLGAMLRTALCSGVGAVVIPKDRSAPPSPAVSKISAGALEHVQLVRVTNLARSLERLKSQGLWVVGLERDAAHSLFRTDLDMPLVLAVGGEEKGLRPLIRKVCDRLVSIPQCCPLDSLNASVAAAVALYEIYRQRSRGEPVR